MTLPALPADRTVLDSASSGEPAPKAAPALAPAAPAPAIGAAVAERTRQTPAPKRVEALPLWKVLLHNDDENDEVYVVRTLIELAAMRTQQALLVMAEANDSGVALVCTTHQERAELYREQFTSKGLTVTVEPDR